MSQKIRSNQTDFGSDTDALLVPKGTSLQASTTTAGALRYNTTTGRLEVADGTGYGGVGIESPTVSSISPTNVNENVDGATTVFTITGTEFFSGVTAVLVGQNASEVAFDSLTRTNSTTLSATVTNSNLLNAQEPYSVKVTNSNGLSATLSDQVNVNAAPAFQTAAGSLGTFEDDERTGISINVEATDPESAGAVFFELSAGSLPAGLSLTSNGNSTCTISGNATQVSDDTTSNFTIRASDVASNVSTRAYSITVNALKAESFNSPGTFAVPTGVSTVELLVVAGGGKAQNGRGGAGGLLYTTSYPVTPGGNVPVTVGGPQAGSSPAPPSGLQRGARGNDSAFGPVSATGGGGGGGPGGQSGTQLTGLPGGSGGGGGGEGGSPGNHAAGSGTQGPSGGVTGYGNPGGNGLGNTGNSPNRGGGGGGAGGSGGPSNASQGDYGPGGVGRQYAIADGSTQVGYAGGGGGGNTDYTYGQTEPQDAGRGSGGGSPNRGNGGSGIVIVRWT